MSKKKNTLKDLDDFLKQQAAVLVTPTQLADKIEAPKQVAQTVIEKRTPEIETSSEKNLIDLKSLGSDRRKLYDIIVKSIEAQDQSSPEDKMLINTALYLKHGSRWKEAIREYWRGKVSS